MKIKKKILLTGGTGFIGKELIKKISDKYEIKCLVRKHSNFEYLKKFKVEFIFGDLRDKESISNSLKNIDMVIHLATSHQKGKEDVNLITSKNLVEICKQKNIKKFIFISSMAANRKLLDDYGRTKLKIEELIKNSGLNYIILRPSIIYSNNNLSLIGSTLKSVPFIIPIMGNGNYKINPVHIQDTVNSIDASIKTKEKNKIYDIAGAENLSFNEIIKICKKRFNIYKLNIHIPIFLAIIMFKMIPIVSTESIKGINEDTNADISLLKNDLKINPISFREGIKNVNL